MKSSSSFTSTAEPLFSPSGEIVYELLRGETHTVAYIVIPPGKSSSAHFHKVSEETYTILAGTARLMIDNQELPYTPGQSCLIERDEVHQIFNAGTHNLEFLAICVPPWIPEDSYSPGEAPA